MVFARGGPGPAGKATNITVLKNAGAQIVADDIFSLQEPFFQDGAVAQAVDGVKAAGVTYFASAGNRGRQSWEGTFLNSANNFHNFGGGDQIQRLATVASGGFIQLVFRWDEAWGHAVTDLDTQLYDANNIPPDPSSRATMTTSTGRTTRSRRSPGPTTPAPPRPSGWRSTASPGAATRS